MGENNEPQSDGADKGDDNQEEETKPKATKELKRKETSAAKRIHHETEPEIDGSGKIQ